MFCERSVFRRTGIFTILLLRTFLAYGQGGNLPGWVLYERGRAFYEEGDLARALEYISLSAPSREDLTPEAIYWIGRIYEAEGDYLLAKKRYEEALGLVQYLYIPAQKWAIYYSLARLAYHGGDRIEYEQYLLSIFDSEVKRDFTTVRREYAYIQTLKTEGLDRLLLLYRYRLTYSLEATLWLGRHYSVEAFWKSSLLHNLYGVLALFTEGVEYLIQENPDFSFPVDMDKAWEEDTDFLINFYEKMVNSEGEGFSFTRDLENFEPLQLEEDRREAEAFISRSFPYFSLTPASYTLLKLEALARPPMELGVLYESLFFTAEALYQEGFTDRALEVWKVLGMSRRDSSWRSLALAKLANPLEVIPFLYTH